MSNTATKKPVGKTTTRKPAGDLSVQEQAAAALAERQAAASAKLESTPGTIEAKAIAALMRERDHRDGCPVFAGTPGHGPDRVEAYERVVTAPSVELRSQGAQQGDTVITLHCLDCGSLRYFTDHESVEAFTDHALEQLAGGSPDEETAGGLDEALG